MRNQLQHFIVRWFTNSVGMYFAITWFAANDPEVTLSLVILAGLVFSLVNSIVKPFVKLLSLPFILLTMGLFVLVVNGLMVGLTFYLIPSLEIGFWGSIFAGLFMSFVNYLANMLIMPYNRPHGHR